MSTKLPRNCRARGRKWSERGDSNPGPLPPQSSCNDTIKHLQGISGTDVPGSFRIGSGQSAAKLPRGTAMSDCPFKLPLSRSPVSKRLLDASGMILSKGISDIDAEYIIRAVNTFEKAKEALRPFADNSDYWSAFKDTDDLTVTPSAPGGWEVPMECAVGDLRRAAAVLKEMEDEG